MIRTIGLWIVVVALCAAPAAWAQNSAKSIKATLSGGNEVPAVSSTGTGEIRITVAADEQSFSYDLTYSGLEGTALFAHIHLGQEGVNGGVIVFLCGGGGKPVCPASGTVTGTVVAADVIGPVGQGIAAGELAEALAAMRAGLTYANVHTTKHPGGEIRGQLKDPAGN